MPLSPIQITALRAKISGILQKHTNATFAHASALLPTKDLQGKLYEANVLADVCENLQMQEGCTINLVNGGLMLRQKGKNIDRNDPHFEVTTPTGVSYELWTDIYFTSLSYFSKTSGVNSRGDFHELDIALIKPKLTGRPSFSDVIIGIECKHTKITKSIIREVLGFRRELAYFNVNTLLTPFGAWPTTVIKSNPNSVHMLYCIDSKVLNFEENCKQFGIILVHRPM